MREKKTVCYDSFEEDFAGTHINTKSIPPDFNYIHRNVFWRIGAFFVYHVIARPTVWLICRFRYGMRIKNRKAIRKVGKSGFFLYGNHTQALDVFVPHLVSYPRRAYIIANPDAVSIPGLKNLVQMLGGLPLPSGIVGLSRLIRVLGYRCSQHACIAIYPEAHIWPYCTFIRPFGSASFSYPVRFGAPAVAMVTTYRKRTRFGKEITPGWTVHVSEPFFPDSSLPRREAQEELCKRVSDFMNTVASSPDNYETVRYIRSQK